MSILVMSIREFNDIMEYLIDVWALEPGVVSSFGVSVVVSNLKSRDGFDDFDPDELHRFIVQGILERGYVVSDESYLRAKVRESYAVSDEFYPRAKVREAIKLWL